MCLVLLTVVSPAQQIDKDIQTLGDLIERIEKETDFSFSYADKLKDHPIEIAQNVDLNNLQSLISQLEIQGVKVVKKGNLIIFKKGKKPQVTKSAIQVSGYVRDAKSGESLIGAHVIDLATGKGVSTNVFGFFSLSVNGDSISVRYLGYEQQNQSIAHYKDDLVVNLAESQQQLSEVVITDFAEIQEVNQMSSFKMSPDQIKAMPVFMGEADVLKSLQLLPGVQAGNEGSSGLYVRGGGPDQNLILLDGVPVYNANHLFGFFSVFNPDAINSVELIKGGFPARYGGRLSSVIDIQMKEGNLNKFEGEGSIGLIASKLTVGGPIKKGKTSYMVSARRTYLDLFTVPIAKAGDASQFGGYHFWDINGKINHIFSPKDRLYFSFYSGKDKFFQVIKNDNTEGINEKENSDLQWGNITSALRWNHRFSDKLFSNVTGIMARYNFDLSTVIDYQYSNDFDFPDIYRENSYLSNVSDLGLKWDFNYYASNSHQIRFGANYAHHTLKPGKSQFKSHLETDTTFGASKIMLHELSAYAEDDISITPLTQLNVGVHFSGATSEQRFYTSWQPRLSLNQKLSNTVSLKASYSRMAQYIHLLVNSGIGLPTDLWVPSTDKVKPQLSDQIALGVATTYRKLEVSIEGYYKQMDNLVEYKDGAGFLDITNEWENKLEFGKGTSYGVEFFLQKKSGKSTGWIGYTWSKSRRDFTNLNFGKKFPYRYDRRHDASIVYNLNLNKKIDIGAVWVFGTGNAVTLPTSTYPKATWSASGPNYDATSKNYPGRNSTRMRSYHRLDLSISFKKTTKWGERKWVFGTYNTYSRLNPTFISFNDDDPQDKKFTQFSLFPLIPNVSYQFKF
ncbi:MAG: TonB-dependent receptor plug domain-containing protein [Cyclobacteriaceae bacterium]